MGFRILEALVKQLDMETRKDLENAVNRCADRDRMSERTEG